MKKIIITAALIFIVLGALTVMRMRVFLKFKNDIAASQDKISQVKTYKQNIMVLEKKMDTLKAEESVFDIKVPAVKNSIELLKEITALAKTSDIYDAELKLEQEEETDEMGRVVGKSFDEDDAQAGKKKKGLKERLEEVPVLADLNTSYDNLIQYLDNIGKLNRKVNIDHLAITRDEKIVPRVRVRIQHQAYYITPLPPGKK